MERTTYKKGDSAGVEGVKFQVSVLMVMLLNSLKHLGNKWKLSSENKEIGDYNKFDDAVLELDDGGAILLQAKHKKTKTAITLDQLLSTNSRKDTFSLPMYFFSFLRTKAKFQTQTVIICTNADMDRKVSGHVDGHSILSGNMLYYLDDGRSYYTFNETILPELKKCAETYLEQNLKGKGFHESEITEESLKEFLQHLQFYSDYPSEIGTFEELTSSLKHIDILFSKATLQEVFNKVEYWFRQPKGIYLTERRAKALFCEINSDKYFELLENYNVLFEPEFLNVEFERLTHIVVDDDYLLHTIKIHQLLKCDKQKVLCISPDDDIDVQGQVVEAFRMPCYKFMMIISSEIRMAEEISAKLREILETDEYKKVVVIASSEVELGPEMESLETHVVDEYVTLRSLSKSTRDRLSKIKCIVFQGRKVSLEELLETSTGYETELGAETLAKLVKRENITVGSEVAPLDRDLSHYYIDRVFERDIKRGEDETGRFVKIRETFAERDIYDVNEKVVAIMDSAGTGKTTALTRLACNIKRTNPHLWVIRIELSEYMKILSARNGKTVDVMQLLNSKSATEMKNQLEKVVFSLSGKVILMLDGMDEISPDYTDLGVDLLRQCYNASNFAKLFVTGRSHMGGLLETRFRTQPFILQPLTEVSQTHFLTEYWLRNLRLSRTYKKRCGEYAEALIRRMSRWIKLRFVQETTFTAVPLQVKMLADIFQSNQSEDSAGWEGCRQFLNGNQTAPKLPQEMNISKLYEMFVETKRNVFIRKGNPDGIPAANRAFNDQFNNYLVHHRILAVETILENSKCDIFSFYKKGTQTVEENLLKVGIVQKLDEEFRFAHRTFAEYFFAESVLIELTTNPLVEFQKFLFDEVLSHPKFNVIRTFFDKLLGKSVDSLPPDIFRSYQNLSYNIELMQSSRLVHELVREGCVATLRLLFKCIDFQIVKDKEAEHVDILTMFFGRPVPYWVASNKLTLLQRLTRWNGVNIQDGGTTPLHRAVENGHLEMVKFLVSQGANTNSRDRAYRTPIHFGIEFFDVIRCLVEHGANIKAKDSRGRTVLEVAIAMDRPEIVSYLFDTILNNEGVDVNDDSIIPYTIAYLGRLETLEGLVLSDLNLDSALQNGETLIFGAARGEQLDMLEYLIYHGADIHAQDEEHNTVLHFISKKGSLLSVAELLVEIAMNVDIKNFRGDTPLHLCVGSLDMVKLVVENGAELNSVNGAGETPIGLAVSKGLLETAKFLVAAGADVNIRDNSLNTLLHLAVTSGQLQMVEYVTELGVDVNSRNSYCRTPFHVAAVHGHLDIVRFFTENGGEANIKDRDGRNVLLVALYESKLDVVKFLVGRGGDFNIKQDDGRTALHLVALSGSPHMVQYLVDLGIDVNVRDNRGRTGLHIAANVNLQLETVKIFVKLGADVNAKDERQCTALHLAAVTHQWDTVKFLLDCMGYINGENYEGTTLYFVNRREQRIEIPIIRNAFFNLIKGQMAFHGGAFNGQLDVVRFFVELGVNVDFQADDGTTPLHFAALSGELNIVEYLLECGADVKIRDNVGRSVLHHAAWCGLQMLVFFLERNVDINVRDNEGRTVLHYAVYKCDLDAIKFLLESGIDLNTRHNDGSTILHVSAVRGLLEATRLFVQRGIDVDIKNNGGQSALHLALVCGLLQTFELLLRCGADVGLVDDAGHTTLHAAAVGGRVEIVEILVELGVAVEARDRGGCAALHLASARGNLDIVAFLLDRGADIDAKGFNGTTALHCAAQEGQLEVVRYLVGRGSDVNIKDNGGCTTLHLAASESRTDKLQGFTFNIEKIKRKQCVFQSIVIFLVEQGADVTIENYSGDTAAALADRKRNFYLLKYLKPQIND